MSGFTRGSTLRGPAMLSIGGTAIRAKDIKVNLALETFNIPSEISDGFDERLSGIPCTIEFTPLGVVSSAVIAKLFAPLSLSIGAEIFGSTDTACVITPSGGLEPITFHCVAITKMPDIIVSATKTQLGSVTVTAILKNATEWTDAAARLTVAASVAAPDFSLDPATIPTLASRIQWGESAPWNALQSREGVTVSISMSAENEMTDEFGLVGMALSDLQASVKFNPMGCNVQQAIAKLAVQGTGVTRGASLAGRAMQLTIESAAAGGLKVVIPSAALKTLPLQYARNLPRFADIELVSLPTTGTVATVSIVPDPE